MCARFTRRSRVYFCYYLDPLTHFLPPAAAVEMNNNTLLNLNAAFYFLTLTDVSGDESEAIDGFLCSVITEMSNQGAGSSALSSRRITSSCCVELN